MNHIDTALLNLAKLNLLICFQVNYYE